MRWFKIGLRRRAALTKIASHAVINERAISQSRRNYCTVLRKDMPRLQIVWVNRARQGTLGGHSIETNHGGEGEKGFPERNGNGNGGQGLEGGGKR